MESKKQKPNDKDKNYKAVTNMVDIVSTILIITLNSSGLSAPLKDRVDQKTRPNSILSTRYPL